MGPLNRISRKIRDVRRYPPLAWGAGDRRDLWLLGLYRNRVPGSRWAAGLVLGGHPVIQPRLKPAGGQRIRVDFVQPGQIDVFDELFIDGIYDLGSVPFAPALVADCGAFCGYFSAMAAGTFPGARVACFEANPANLPMLEAQLALLDPKVELQAAAVHVRDGLADFSGGGMGGTLVGSGESADTRRVPCIDFPRWLRERAPESLVWKLDVEGAEADLLPASLAFLPGRTACFLETHYPDAKCRELLAPYADAGFAVREVRRRPAASGGFDYVEWRLTRNP